MSNRDLKIALGALSTAALDAVAALGSPGAPSPAQLRADSTVISESLAPADAGPKRANMKSLGFWTDRALWRQLHHLAIEEETTVESLLNEALTLLFRSRERDGV